MVLIHQQHFLIVYNFWLFWFKEYCGNTSYVSMFVVGAKQLSL